MSILKRRLNLTMVQFTAAKAAETWPDLWGRTCAVQVTDHVKFSRKLHVYITHILLLSHLEVQ